MKNQSRVRALLALPLVALIIVGCAAPSPTPVPPTAVPPTAVPAATAVPPTATSVPPTATTAPTATAVPPTATKAPTVAPTNTKPAEGGPTEEKEDMAKFFPKTAPSISAGAKVYAANCVTCHGDKGDGKGPVGAALKPPPADFTDLDFAHGDPPEDWYQSITNGRPGTAMPAFQGKLSEADIWNVLFYVRRFATTPDKIAQGKDLYAKNCVACHGEKGDGKGPAGAALKPPPADFTDRQMMAAHASQELFDTLTKGEGTMPSYKTQLTDDQRWNLVEYLWTFVYAP